MNVRAYLLPLTFSVLLLEPRSSATARGGADGETDGCTSGFMSVDRIRAVLNRGLSYLELFYFYNRQAIIPGINFTCNGNIRSWIFGARWQGGSPQAVSYTELQIWRNSGNGSYTKVGKTTIMIEETGTGQLYRYPLSSPLPFQGGDILGYYQPSSSRRQFGLLFESEHGHREYYTGEDSAASHFNVSDSRISSTPTPNRHLLIAAETDSPGCECGFMSVERMRILLLGLDSVGYGVTNDRRQQITPDMKFTCDGIITKWIIGAKWSDDDTSYPELQLWREIGNDTYQKINETLIAIETESGDDVYEYDNFSPIPFQAGDILGVYVPPEWLSKLILISEGDRGPTNYFISTTDSDTMSKQETIHLHSNIYSAVYHPLVAVDISVKSSPATKSVTDPTHISSSTFLPLLLLFPLLHLM